MTNIKLILSDEQLEVIFEALHIAESDLESKGFSTKQIIETMKHLQDQI